jgi:hypothetical protein
MASQSCGSRPSSSGKIVSIVSDIERLYLQ